MFSMLKVNNFSSNVLTYMDRIKLMQVNLPRKQERRKNVSYIATNHSIIHKWQIIEYSHDEFAWLKVKRSGVEYVVLGGVIQFQCLKHVGWTHLGKAFL